MSNNLSLQYVIAPWQLIISMSQGGYISLITVIRSKVLTCRNFHIIFSFEISHFICLNRIQFVVWLNFHHVFINDMHLIGTRPNLLQRNLKSHTVMFDEIKRWEFELKIYNVLHDQYLLNLVFSWDRAKLCCLNIQFSIVILIFAKLYWNWPFLSTSQLGGVYNSYDFTSDHNIIIMVLKNFS